MENMFKALSSLVRGLKKNLSGVSDTVNTISTKFNECVWFPTAKGNIETEIVAMRAGYIGDSSYGYAYYTSIGLLGTDFNKFRPGQKIAAYLNGERYEGVVSQSYGLVCGPARFGFNSYEGGDFYCMVSGDYRGDVLRIELFAVEHGDNEIPASMLPHEVVNEDYVAEYASELKKESTLKYIDQSFEIPEGGKWCSIAYGDGKFVAVKNDGYTIAHSEDGCTWKVPQPSSTTGYDGGGWVYSYLNELKTPTSIVYGDGRFVVVGSNTDVVAYSVDEGHYVVNWKNSRLPASRNWTSVTYGEGVFLAVASESNKGAYSYDGIAWEEFTLPVTANWKDVVYGGCLFQAIASDSITATCFTKKNGTNEGYAPGNINNWTLRTTISGSAYNEKIDLTSIVYAYGATTFKFIAIAKGHSKIFIHGTISDYLTAYNPYNGVTVLPRVADWCAACCGEDKFVALAAHSNMAIAGNYQLLNTTETILPFEAEWSAVCYGDGKFVAIASDSKKVAVSNDGITWVDSYTGFVQNGIMMGNLASKQYVDAAIKAYVDSAIATSNNGTGE